VGARPQIVGSGAPEIVRLGRIMRDDAPWARLCRWRRWDLGRSPWEVAVCIIDPLPDPYVNDPVVWVENRLGEFFWSVQRR
jgi:hypothetical protein